LTRGAFPRQAPLDRIMAARLLPHPNTGSVLLFLGCWLFFGCLINAKNMEDFNLQHIGVEAIAERGNFHLEGSPTPQLQTRGDVFHFEEHTYAAKQPGQFFLGALAYRAVALTGLRYRDDYRQTAAWVTFGSASLILALGIVALQRVSAAWTRDIPRSHLNAVAAAGGTTLLAYSGLPHHDLIAAGLIAIALACCQAACNASHRGWAQVSAGAAGFCLGLTLTVSMLPAFGIFVLGLYALSVLTATERMALFIGGVLGIAPLLIYNTTSFGHPFLLANVAGNFRDTFWTVNLVNMQDKTSFYALLTLQYMPIAALGLLGAFLLPPELRREKLALLLSILAVLTHLSGIETVGHCQYGPRYLLPLIPLAILGLNGFWLSRCRDAVTLLSVALITYGLLINVGGALGGGMYCAWWEFAGARHWESILHGGDLVRPLADKLTVPAVLTLSLYIGWLVRYSGERQDSPCCAIRK
jgi:hypothetical protein